MKLLKLLLVIVLLLCFFSSYAQDIITLKNGDEIKAKVTELSATEIKYKRFEQQSGPTIVVPTANVFTIKYEDGTKEVITPLGSSASESAATIPAAAQQSKSASNGKRNYFGIYANPVGFLTFGPMVGAELTLNKFILEVNLRFPSFGLLMPYIVADREINMDESIGVGVGAKFYNAKPHGGFYVGGFLEYWTQSFTYLDGSNDTGESKGVLFGTNIGYKFQFNSGVYLRTGGYLGLAYETTFDLHTTYGLEDYSGGVYPFGLLDIAIGFRF